MNKYFKYIYILGLAFSAVSCADKDDFDGIVEVFDRPIFDDNTETGAKLKSIYEKYNMVIKPTFDVAEYTFNWSDLVSQVDHNSAGMRYTPADLNYVLPVVDSIENWLLTVFPEEFTKKYAPLNVLLVDTLGYKAATYNYDIDDYEYPYRSIYEGNVTSNYVALSYVSSRFDAKKNTRELRESWLSLFIEKMMINWPSPAEFALVSADAYAKTSFTNAEDVITKYSLLKKGRTKQTSSSASASWGKVSLQQDFGDFVAFIVFTPESEKQIVYAKNTNMMSKVNLVKSYFISNFGIELPYRPISN